MTKLDNTIELLSKALNDPLIVQSFSGVRTRFGDGPEISEEHTILAYAYGLAYAKQVLADVSKGIILIGRDPRPTGDALASSLSKGFLAGAARAKCRVKIVNLGIITTPLIQTAMRSLKAAGGVMITASHNPLTDNGFKFMTGFKSSGLKDEAPPGALLSALAMAEVIENVASILESDAKEFYAHLNKIDDKILRKAFENEENHSLRIKAERAYLDSIGKEWRVQPHCLKPLVLGPVLLDPNGGAACGIGARVLEHFGVRAIEINAELGYPEHSIDMDGIDPASGRHTLIRVSRAALRESARFAIAFDYDADRGNIVLPGLDENAIIQPQTVATMNIALALAHREISAKNSNNKLAVVMSDATSGSCEKVASLFGAEVFMVETGEINVVSKMHQLCREGYDAPVGVEGANGGTIFGESTCRDGLQTALCAALADEQPFLAEQWIRALNQNNHHVEKPEVLRLPELLSAMPRNFNRIFKIQGPDISHGEFKSRIEDNFEKEAWRDLSKIFESYRFINYEGAEIVQKRTGDETGGWRVEVKNDNDRAFIFIRGSRTESGVWRMIVDSSNAILGEALIQAGVNVMTAASPNIVIR